MSEKEYNKIITTLEILSNSVEYNKVMNPDMSESEVYDTGENLIKSVEEEDGV
jgi:hypothetical protein